MRDVVALVAIEVARAGTLEQPTVSIHVLLWEVRSTQCDDDSVARHRVVVARVAGRSRMSELPAISASSQEGIHIYLRVRPSKKPSSHVSYVEDDRIEFVVPRALNEGQFVNNQKDQYLFQFDGILQQDAKQEDVFDLIARKNILASLDGINATIFAYGQTGSGKTFTITGKPCNGISPGFLACLGCAALMDGWMWRAHCQGGPSGTWIAGSSRGQSLSCLRSWPSGRE